MTILPADGAYPVPDAVDDVTGAATHISHTAAGNPRRSPGRHPARRGSYRILLCDSPDSNPSGAGCSVMARTAAPVPDPSRRRPPRAGAPGPRRHAAARARRVVVAAAALTGPVAVMVAGRIAEREAS